MAVLNSNKSKTVERGIFTFYKGAIECNGESSGGTNKAFKIFNKKEEISHFIQISQIARVWKANLPMASWLLGVAIGLIILGFVVMSTDFWFLGLLFLVSGVVCGYFYLTKRRYMLLIEISSSGVYSFVSPEGEYVNKGYSMILDVINKREDERTKIIYNISTGQVQTFVAGDHAKVGV